MPANAGVAMLCAGWVVGRGPLQRTARTPEGAGPAARRLAACKPARAVANSVPPVHGVAAALVIVLAFAAAWTAFQPVRAVHASDRAFDRLDPGQPDAAAATARIATERNPLSAEALFELAAIEPGARRPQGGAGRAREGGATRAGEPPRRGGSSATCG